MPRWALIFHLAGLILKHLYSRNFHSFECHMKKVIKERTTKSDSCTDSAFSIVNKKPWSSPKSDVYNWKKIKIVGIYYFSFLILRPTKMCQGFIILSVMFIIPNYNIHMLRWSGAKTKLIDIGKKPIDFT